MPFSTLYSIAVSIIVLGVLVLFHEAGHFAVARALGFKVEEFSIGFGPRILKWVQGESEYSIRILPLGGFVRFLGEDEKSDDKRAFNNQAVWKRILVIIAGPLMNIILAILLSIIILSTYGDYFPTPVIGEVVKNSAADKTGLKVGDRIIQINGFAIKDYKDVSNIVQKNSNHTLDIKVKRKSEVLSFKVKPYYDVNTKTKRIGIAFGQEKRSLNLWESVKLSIQWIFYIVQQMLVFLGRLFFKGQGVNDLAGPVGVISLIGQAARQSMEMVMRLAVIISINLGIMNLLPFPALDGGRLVFLGIEGVRGKPLNQEREGFIHFAGFIILILLMIIFTYKDITR